jgi:hypothetical protein
MGQAQEKLVFTLPEFDTGQYAGCEFLMKGGDALLTVKVDELPSSPVVIQFRRVRWHQFTSLHLCSAAMVKGAYFRLVELASDELAEFIKKDPRPPYKELHHFRMFLDESGCHEVFSESASLLPHRAT